MMNNQTKPTVKRIELSDGSHYNEYTYQYKGWTYKEGLFGNCLQDRDGKIHRPFGMQPRNVDDAIKYIAKLARG